MWQAILGTSRSQFLILAPLCVSPALAYASAMRLPMNLVEISLCYLAAILSHASVNMLNEYHDHHSGLDNLTQRTPFNGGSGTLQKRPENAGIVRTVSMILLLLTVAIGLYFIWLRGYELLIIGLLACASVLFYTPQINKMPLVCLIAPGFGFGVGFTLGSFIALTGHKDFGILLVTLPIFLLVNNLLLLNQFPDKSADEQSGRQHLIIKYGEKAGKNVYLANLTLLTFATILINDWFNFGLAGALLLLPLLASCISLFGLTLYISHKNLATFTPFLASNVVATLSYPAILTGLLLLH